MRLKWHWKIRHRQKSDSISRDSVIASERPCCVASLYPVVVEQRANIIISIPNRASVNTEKEQSQDKGKVEKQGVCAGRLTSTNTQSKNQDNEKTEKHGACMLVLTSTNAHIKNQGNEKTEKHRVGARRFTPINTQSKKKNNAAENRETRGGCTSSQLPHQFRFLEASQLVILLARDGKIKYKFRIL